MSVKIYVECEQCEACVAPTPATYGQSWSILGDRTELYLDLRIFLPERWSMDTDDHIFCSPKCLKAYRAEHLADQIAALQAELEAI